MINHLFSCENPWPHQLHGVQQTIETLQGGSKSVCLTAPTGSGKTHCQIALARWAVEQQKQVLLLTNRILLTDQTRRVFQDNEMDCGVISASMKHLERADAPCQIATIQTILARRRNDMEYFPKADLVLVDEVHQISSGESAELLDLYRIRGAKIVGVTATPLGVSNVCEDLVVAARTRDLQKAGILVKARHHAPSELDTRSLVRKRVDLSLTEDDARRTWGPLTGNKEVRTRIVGNMLEHLKRLHPDLTHTLAFAPGVKESVWGAHFCFSMGIRAMHVDGDDFWVDGQTYDRKSQPKLFAESMEAWRGGHIPVLFNRFVLREGIDEPQIKCIWVCTPVASYRSAVQMVGRGLRTHPSKDELILIDHGGMWWRHGTFNCNVAWEDFYDCPDADGMSKARIMQYRQSGEPIGTTCPQCGMVHRAKARFTVCQYCGHELQLSKPSRPILQADGQLVEVTGQPIKKWDIRETPEAQRIWESLYWNIVKNKKKDDVTFNQLYGRFGYKTAVLAGSSARPNFFKAYYPPRTLPLMPKRESGWFRYVRETPMEDLIPCPMTNP